MPTVRKSNGVKYKTVEAEVCAGKTAITMERAKEILGWRVIKEGAHHINDLLGNRVHLDANISNRPIYPSVILCLKQEHLRKRWRLNGETIILDRVGQVKNGQHTLISFIYACQEWDKDPTKWKEYWPEQPILEKVIVTGINEDDITANTIDNVKARSLTDVIYRSEFFEGLDPEIKAFFDALDSNGRRRAAKTLDYATRILWDRTGASLDPYAPRRTHSESADFITRHPRLIPCTKVILEKEGKTNRISRYIHPGYATGLLYFMGASTTESEDYQLGSPPSESTIDWTSWEKACTFFTKLAEQSVKALQAAYAALGEDITEAERRALIIKAWFCFNNGKSITDTSLLLEYGENNTGERVLTEFPIIGGIDIGHPSAADESTITCDDPSPEEIEKRAKKVRTKHSTLKPKREGNSWAAGDVAWVDDESEPYLATLTEDPMKCDAGPDRVMVQTADGQDWEVEVDSLSLERPDSSDNDQEYQDDKSYSPEEGEGKGEDTADDPVKTLVRKTSSNKHGIKLGILLWAVLNGEPWQGRVVEVSGNKIRLKVQQGFQGANSLRVVRKDDLFTEQPQVKE